MSSIYFKNSQFAKIIITPQSLNKKIDKEVLKKLKENYEGKCSKVGYIKKDSIEVINRTIGEMEMGQFNGNIIYNVEYVADVCNPAEMTPIDVKVISINKIGILCVYGDSDNQPLKVLLPRQSHLENEDFKDIEVGDKITIEVIGKKFELNETFISVVGKLLKKI